MTDSYWPQDQRDIDAREALQKRGQYRKKPVVIEAVQFTQEMLEAHLFDKALLPEGLRITSSTYHPGDRKIWSFRAGIETLEGFMEASIGDWIITGVKGERYPCKPDIFAQTYEPTARPAPEALGAAKGVTDEIAMRVALAIIANLEDRRGVLDDVDDEIKQEIAEEIALTIKAKTFPSAKDQS